MVKVKSKCFMEILELWNPNSAAIVKNVYCTPPVVNFIGFYL